MVAAEAAVGAVDATARLQRTELLFELGAAGAPAARRAEWAAEAEALAAVCRGALQRRPPRTPTDVQPRLCPQTVATNRIPPSTSHHNVLGATSSFS